MMYQLSLRIKTLTPVILARSSGENIVATTDDFFSGAVVRGLLAEKYIRDKNLNDAERDETFYKFFLGGNLTFGPAYYVVSDVGIAYPLPLSLTHDKNKENVFDLALGEEGKPGYKGMKGFGCIADNGEITQATVKKNLELHMSRQGDNERIVGSSKDGQMYNYEALAADQCFKSVIFGKKEVLQELLDSFTDLQNGNIMYIGRSKHTQYGKCFVNFGALEPCHTEIIKGNVALRFVTDYLPSDQCFTSAVQALNDVVEKLADKGVKLQIVDVFSETCEQDGFVGVWRLKRSSQRGLKAGTVVVLDKKNWTEEELTTIQDFGWSGCGERCIDGFGRFELYDVDVKKHFAKTLAVTNNLQENHGEFSDAVKKVVAKIIEAHITEKLQNLGAEDIAKRKVRKKANAHFCVRMEELCQEKSKFQAEIRDNSSADKTLNLLAYRGISLKEILSGYKPAPYEEQWSYVIQDIGDLARETGVKLPDAGDSEIFKIYWQWYWRMARKKSKDEEAQNNGESKEM